MLSRSEDACPERVGVTVMAEGGIVVGIEGAVDTEESDGTLGSSIELDALPCEWPVERLTGPASYLENGLDEEVDREAVVFFVSAFA